MTAARRKPELLVPASSLEVLRCAVRYGADAVYIGGEAFGLRAKAKNFSPEEMAEGIAFAHANGVRVHVTANILAHNYDLDGARKYFCELRDMTYQIQEKDLAWLTVAKNRSRYDVAQPGSEQDAKMVEYRVGQVVPAHPDALIVADPGMYSICREEWPDAEIHISTQANNTNYATYRFWHQMGAKRVVSARELSLQEIAEIRKNIPDDMEIESFVHGAMCISYSGRCLLSNYFTGRDANHGACTHPCRWKYAVMEESRPGEYLPVEENERGTFLFNSRDLCMIEHVPELVAAGIDSWKIEGRMKTALYVATVARTYRRAIDDYFEDPALYEKNLPWYREQIAMCTYRKFCTGFFFGKPNEESQIYDNNTYSSDAIYLAMVDRTGNLDLVANDQESSAIPAENLLAAGQQSRWMAHFEQKNKFSVGDEIEIMKPDGRDMKVKVLEMYHEFTEEDTQSGTLTREGAQKTTLGLITAVDNCPHSREKVWILLSQAQAEVGDILRIPGRPKE